MLCRLSRVRFLSPPAVLSVPGKIFCLTGSGSGSVLLLFAIHIYESVNGLQGLFIMMVCRPAYGWNSSTGGCVSIWLSVAGNPLLRYLTFRQQRRHVKRLHRGKITTNASDRSFDLMRLAFLRHCKHTMCGGVLCKYENVMNLSWFYLKLMSSFKHFFLSVCFFMLRWFPSGSLACLWCYVELQWFFGGSIGCVYIASRPSKVLECVFISPSFVLHRLFSGCSMMRRHFFDSSSLVL